MRLILVVLALFFTACGSGRSHFVSLQELDPSIILEMRYFDEYNFVGKQIDGYEAPVCLLTKQAAKALVAVQAELKKEGRSLRVYDCYRPQRAVNHFVKWAEDLTDQTLKKHFYPEVEKEHLFRDGYIAKQSGHSRGSTVDLTIDGLDMGTRYDLFDPRSNTDNQIVGEAARANRLLLKRVMEKHGFKNYDKEWWHYTLVNEPFPNRYFDFVVK